MTLRIRVFGGLDAFRDDVVLTWVPVQRLRSALLVYLALERATRREQLTSLLWPDEKPEVARHTLRQLLYTLRQALGEGFVTQQGDTLRVAQQVDIDAVQMESALEREDFAAAACLYRGPFLHGVRLSESREFEAWVDRQRARYARLYRRACRGWIDGLVIGGRVTDAIEAARAWVSVEPFEDEAQHRLIELLAASGQRSEALEQFAIYERLLKGEDLEPLDETKALSVQLRAAEPVAVGAVHASPLSPGGRTSSPQLTFADAVVGASTFNFAALARELRPDLELVRPLGHGRSGRVFLAREAHLDRLVAVKVLAPELAGEWIPLARFEREARAAAALTHPNTVAVYRFGYLSSGIPYLVLQYVKGGTLEERLARPDPVSVSVARQVLADIAAGLAAAHEGGFIHRDLRPGNVLCDDETGRVLVSDFGMAGLLADSRGTEPRLTARGQVFAAPEYVSPEQLSNEDATAASDVYALGVIGYRLLTGEPPYRATRASTAITEQLLEPPRPLRSLRDDLDESLAELLERCLARDPRQRPSAAFLARALEDSTAGSGERALDPGRRWLGRLAARIRGRRGRTQ